MSFLSLLWSFRRVIGVALLAIGILWGVHTVLAWRADAHKLKDAEDLIAMRDRTIQQEQDCLAGTSCAARFDKLVLDGAKAVNDAKAEADKQYQAQKKEYEDRAQTKRDELQRMVKDGQKQLAQLNEQLLHAIATSQSCREWANTLIPESCLNAVEPKKTQP